MSVHAINPADDAAQAVRIDLAASHRLAVLHELEEGIDNHFTVTVPGYDDRYFVLPFGRHWSEATASAMIVFDESGATLEGDGEVELSANCIHAPIHRVTGTKVVMHTHQTWALALNMLQDNELVPASQTACFFHGRVAYDDAYDGVANFHSEGERLASALGSNHTMFMKNHGVLVIGETVAQAYHRLYFLERVCRAQVLAMSTGRPLARLPDEIVAAVNTPVEHDSHPGKLRIEMFFDAMKRVIDRENPGYEI